jgi:hypothetical protein
MTTITLKGRGRKKVYVVNKDLKPAHYTNSSDNPDSEIELPQGKPKLKLKPKKKNKTPPPAPKPKPQSVAAPKPVKAPCTPQLLKTKQLGRVVRLCDALPAIFDLESPRPLAIGILDELQANLPGDLSKRAVKGALKIYTKLPQYQQAIKSGLVRINAQGQETEAPTQEHIEHADKLLERWQSIQSTWPELVDDAKNKYPQVFTPYG